MNNDGRRGRRPYCNAGILSHTLIPGPDELVSEDLKKIQILKADTEKHIEVLKHEVNTRYIWNLDGRD